MTESKKTARKGLRVGRLMAAPARSDGKVLDNWSFVTPILGPGGKTETIGVKVCLVNTDSGLSFEARFSVKEPPILDTDIQRLYERVRTRLEQVEALRMGVVWEDWLKVSVAGWDEERSGRSARAQMTIEVEAFKHAVDPQTGIAYSLSRNGLWAHVLDKPKSVHDAPAAPPPRGEIDLENLDALGIGNRNDVEISYIPATPANLAALEDVRARLRSLRVRLSDLLSQPAIATTLSDLASTLPLLPAPPSDPSSDPSSDPTAHPKAT